MESSEHGVRRRVQELFEGDELNRIYERAVREALLMHKRAGNPVPIERDRELVWVKPDEIDADGNLVSRHD